jgi:hypothetical protein
MQREKKKRIEKRKDEETTDHVEKDTSSAETSED